MYYEKECVFKKRINVYMYTRVCLRYKADGYDYGYAFISVYSKTLAYSTPVLAGVALGIFGLMQAFFQIPFWCF